MITSTPIPLGAVFHTGESIPDYYPMRRGQCELYFDSIVIGNLSDYCECGDLNPSFYDEISIHERSGAFEIRAWVKFSLEIEENKGVDIQTCGEYSTAVDLRAEDIVKLTVSDIAGRRGYKPTHYFRAVVEQLIKEKLS